MEDTQELQLLADKIQIMKGTAHHFLTVHDTLKCIEDVLDILLEMNNMELRTNCNDSVCVQLKGNV